jgi:diguanylate cyclase (GGDEF)-like protein
VDPFSLSLTATLSRFRACLCAIAWLVGATALPAQRYTFRQYGPSDGLTNLSVNCLLQDRAGFLWVGTDNGLFRYDGKSFQAYGHPEGLPNSEIRSLAESPDGSLWVATQDEIARSIRGRFIPLDTGIKGLFLGLGFDSKGTLYLENTSGILRGLPGGEGSYRFTMAAPGEVGGLFIEGQDVWFRRDGDLWRMRGGTVERMGSPAGLPNDRWGAIVRDTHGNLWVRSNTRLFEQSGGQARFIDRSEGIPHGMVPRLYTDRHGRVFVSSNSGLVVLDGETRTEIDPRHGLPSDGVSPVLIDRDESLWMGMRGGGLIRRLGQGEWLSWTKEDGLLNDGVWSILHDRSGRLWVGTGGGLNLYASDGRLSASWTAHAGLTGDSVFSLLQTPSGEVLAGTAPAGIARFSAGGKLLHTYGASSGLVLEQINSMALDQENRLWVAGSGGFYRSLAPVTSGSLAFDRVPIPGIPANAYFHRVQVDEGGAVWVTTSYGLAHLEGSAWRVFTDRDGLTSSDLSAVLVGRGQVWIAYRDALGIARLSFHGQQVQVTNITENDGLSSGLIYAMTFDNSGRLWASTDNGVDVLEQGHWRHYGTEDGLIWDDGDDLALSADAEGNVWIGTSRGLSRFTRPSFPLPDLPSAIVLTSIQGVTEDYLPTDHPVLSRSQDSLQIQFSGLNFSSPTHTRYRYRLLGRKKAWTDTHETSVRFEGLPGGEYVFEVIAAGANGLWSPVPARFAFTVKPPWWLTWWFLAGSVLVAFLFSRIFWWYRVHALIVAKERLEKLVVERTAELQESHRRLEEIAYYDVLTSLPNRRMFTEQFRSRLALSRRHGTMFALLLIDLDDFKEINDTHGHDAGDAVLVEVAQVLHATARESDCVARLGGDEFAILLIRPTDPAGITMASQRIIESLAGGVDFKGTKLMARCSVGVAIYPTDGDSQDTLYKAADMALYEAKRNGGGRACLFDALPADGR